MPMNRRGAIKTIFYSHLNFIAAANPNDGSENWRRVSVRDGGLARHKLMPTGCYLKRQSVVALGRVEKLRERQRSIEPGRFAQCGTFKRKADRYGSCGAD